MRVHLLSPGFTTPNGRAFLFPLVVWRRELGERDVHLRFFTHLAPEVTECEVLIVDSKFHRGRWMADTEGVLAEFAELRGRVDWLLYFDTTDSTGGLQVELLAIVDAYFKSQLLRNREQYLQPMYGRRIYTDYYHRVYGVTDSVPEFSEPVPDADLLDKLRVSWNAGLANYSLYGPSRMALYDRIPVRRLLRFPTGFVPPSVSRPNDLSCRFGTHYARETVAWQRKEIRRRLGARIATEKLPRRQYFRELETSKLIISPFGYGEITLKDFEALLSGGLLVKPDMSHLETWPDLFRAGQTMITHGWDLEDLEDSLGEALEEYTRFREVAEHGQEVYRGHIATREASELFCDHFWTLLSKKTGGKGERAREHAARCFV